MSRGKIPEHIRRQVRKDCYFGCVICGCPIFQYDHMIEYSVVPEHDGENLVLLCAHHHQDKTYNRLSLEKVRHAKSNPANKKRSQTSAYKIESNREVDLVVGSNRSGAQMSKDRSDHYVIWVNGIGFLVIHYEDGWITFSMVASDSDGNPVLVVDHGELSLSTGIWDYRYEGTRLKIWAGRGDVIFEADISNNKIHVFKGNFFTKDKDGFSVDQGLMVMLSHGDLVGVYAGNTCYNCSSGSWAFVRAEKCPNGYPSGFGSSRIV